MGCYPQRRGRLPAKRLPGGTRENTGVWCNLGEGAVICWWQDASLSAAATIWKGPSLAPGMDQSSMGRYKEARQRSCMEFVSRKLILCLLWWWRIPGFREWDLQKHPAQPVTPLTISRVKWAVAARQAAVKEGEKHCFAKDVARAVPSQSQESQQEVIWTRLGWNKQKVRWPLCIRIIIAADKFCISNKGKTLNRASVERLGGARKTINPYVLGLEPTGSESQGAVPPLPQYHHCALHNQLHLGSTSCPKAPSTAAKYDGLQKYLSPSSIFTLKITSQATTHMWSPCLCYPTLPRKTI